MMGDQTVDRLAFRRHGATLGGRNALGHVAEHGGGRLAGQSVIAETKCADQRAVDDEIGIAPDRRGEVRIAPQIQAEMADVLRGIFGLALRAQHHLVDEMRVLRSRDAVEDRIELRCAQRPLLRQPDVEGTQELPQGDDLLDRRLVVDAVHERRLPGFERLRGGDIGEDHELLDQPVGVEPLRHHDAIDRAVRATAGSCARECRDREVRAPRAPDEAMRRPHRAASEPCSTSGPVDIVRRAVDGPLRLLV